MKVTLRLTIACAAVIASGCASRTEPVWQNAKPGTDHAFLYGFFKVHNPKSSRAADATVSIRIQCDDDSTYSIKFDPAEYLQTIAIKPAVCSITDLVFITESNTEHKAAPLKLPYFKDKRLLANVAYYIGDFTSEASVTTSWSRFEDYGNIYTQWRLQALQDNYMQTTQEFRDAYKHFTKVPTLNLMRPYSPTAQQ